MVEPLSQWFECIGDFSVVNKPAGFWIHLASNGNLTFERVTVQSKAFVIFGHARKAMRGFKSEFLNEINEHCSQS